MSEKSNDTSDTYSKSKSSPRIVKNPLLNISVTGITLDDHSNKPQLLPAAPVVMQTSRVDPKQLVTVGNTSQVDTEALDEINLNSTSDETQPAVIEPNENNNLEQQGNSDSILSQAASSFSALPSVASTVFSTFSKRIYSGSTSRERTPTTDSSGAQNQDINANPAPTLPTDIPSYYQQQPPPQNFAFPSQQGHLGSESSGLSQPVAPPPLYPPSIAVNNDPSVPPAVGLVGYESTPQLLANVEPPKLYTPSELPTATPLAPPSTGGQNTYRLSAKKKLYAPIPGLSDQTQQPVTAPNPLSGPIVFDSSQQVPGPQPLPIGAGEPVNYFNQSTPQQQLNPSDQDDRRTGGLFSLTNLVPTGVFQNISGFVQSAAVTLTQGNKSEPFQQQNTGASVDLFNAPHATSYSVEPTLSPQSVQLPPPPEFVNPFTPPQQHVQAQQQQVPASVSIPAPTLSGFFGPPQPSAAISAPYSVGQAPPLFVPTEQTAFNIFTPDTKSVPQAIYTPPTLFAAGTSTSALLQPSSTSATSFEVSQQLPPQASVGVAPPPSFSTPPSATSTAAPPPKGAGTSFRLQKGTRLYRSPLAPAETAPSIVDQSPLQAPFGGQAPLVTPQGPFNPTSSSAPYPVVSSSVPNFFTPYTPGAQAQFPSSDPIGQQFISDTGSVPSPVNFFSPPSVQDVEKPEGGEKSEPIATVAQTVAPAAEGVNPGESLLQDTNIPVSGILLNTIEPVIDEEEPKEAASSIPVEPLSVPQQPHEATAPPESAFLEESVDALDETLEKLGLDTKSPVNLSVNLLPPPATQTSVFGGQTNPFRKEVQLAEVATAEVSKPATLANFFTPVSSESSSVGGTFNFFAPPATETQSVGSSQTTTATTTTDSDLFDQRVNFFNSPSSSEAANEQSKHIPRSTDSSTTFEYIPPPPLAADSVEVSTSATIAPPIGFDNVIANIQDNKTSIESTVSASGTTTNSFTNFFNQPSESNAKATQKDDKSSTDHTTFFDFFSPQSSQQQRQNQEQQQIPTIGFVEPPQVSFTDQQQQRQQQQQQQQTQQQQQESQIFEDQRIQNFFNNPPPPPKEDRTDSHDLNYDLVHSGLAIKNLQGRSVTPASNVVEPPSSSCSEFSELNISTASAQRSLVENQSISKEVDADKSAATASNEVIPPAVKEAPPQADKKYYSDLPEEILQELRMANMLVDEADTNMPPPSAVAYAPAVKHWFYKQNVGTKHLWTPFSHYDSALLETSLAMGDEMPTLVAVEGGRYDVDIRKRTKVPVYWEGKPIEVRRCSWFFKGTDSKYVPYEEQIADLLENEYKQAAESGVWHQKIILSQGEQVVFHGPTVIVHFQRSQAEDAWGGTSQTSTRPRVVKRDLNDFTIDQGESQRVDHLLFMVHGIGSACDLKLRTVEEVVDDFRSAAQQLVQSHYKNSTDMGIVGRVEVLPISWHSDLHSEELGIDEKLKSITLESIPKLRNFTNDTLLDVLFYTSPKYCQKIMNTVAASMNSVYLLYRQRHPEFNGGVSLAGHSLGSLILFDLLCHQQPLKESEENMENPDQYTNVQQSFSSMHSYHGPSLESTEVGSQQVGYTMGPAGTGQPFIHYTQLIFQPKKFFALGSPIGMFVTIRGIDKLGLDFKLPTCSGFYNIFHPFDPVAYRIEALVNPDMSTIRPVLIPHHKGRKRMHLELKETMTRVGADLKQRFFDTFKSTLESVNFLGASTKSKKEAEETMEKEVNKVLEMQKQLEEQQQQHDQDFEHQSSTALDTSQSTTSGQLRTRADSTSTVHSDTEMVEIDFPLGKLNDAKRVDYVLQEAPLEFFNEYVFALSSHVCYWSSEDTILFVMKEIYSGLGISPDSQVPQQTMTIERPSSRTSVIHSPTS